MARIETDLISLDFLCSLPLHLAKDSLIVSPFVFLLSPNPTFIPIRNPREVAPHGIFRVPLSYFLGPEFRYTVDDSSEGHHTLRELGPPPTLRHSVSTSWWKQRKVHYFDVPSKIWESDSPGSAAEAMHKVSWMTADIAVEVATIAYATRPEFECNVDWAGMVGELGHWQARSEGEGGLGGDDMRAGRL